jgi:hypothetical protein
VALDKYMSKNENTKKQSKNKASRIKQKLATLTVTKVISVRIVLKLNLSFIRLSRLIYLTWDPKMTLAL